MLPPLGLLGIHHYYLRNYKRGLLYTVTLGCLTLGCFVDIFRLPRMLRQYNNDLYVPNDIESADDERQEEISDRKGF